MYEAPFLQFSMSDWYLMLGNLLAVGQLSCLINVFVYTGIQALRPSMELLSVTVTKEKLFDINNLQTG